MKKGNEHYESIETLSKRLGVSLLKLHELRISGIVRTKIDWSKAEAYRITYCIEDADSWAKKHNINNQSNNN